MPARQQVTFKPAFALMLAQHLHHAAIGCDVIVPGNNCCGRTTIGNFEHRTPAVGGRLVRTEDAEVFRIHFRHVADELALDAGSFAFHGPGPGRLHRVITEIRQAQVLQEKAAVGVGIGAHTALAFRRELGKFGAQFAGFIEQLLWPVASQPVLQNLHMPRMTHVAHRHLMRAEGAFGGFAIHELRAGPAFR